MSQVIATVANAVTAVGLVVVVLQLRGAQRARFRAFEDMYTQRYWSLVDSMSPACEFDSPEAANGDQLGPEDRSIVRSYIRLTEDQLEMRRIGWIK